MVLRTIVIASALFLASALLFGQSAEQHPEWPGKGQLFVGTCYQPVDRSPEQIRQDIALMKQAGFTLVRMGDLAWDAFEPSEGHFEFAWFDQILEQMNSAGITVILDIGGSPAPIWLPHKYPSVNMVNEHGGTLHGRYQRSGLSRAPDSVCRRVDPALCSQSCAGGNWLQQRDRQWRHVVLRRGSAEIHRGVEGALRDNRKSQ